MSSYGSTYYGGSRRNNDEIGITMGGCCGVLLVLGLISACGFFVVPPGSIGLVITLGRIKSFYPGAHYRNPMISKIVYMSSKKQLLKENSLTPTKEGLSVELDTAVIFYLEPEMAGDLYTKVGLDYVRTLVEPEVASALRGLTSESEAKALYTSGRNLIQIAVRDELALKLGPKGIKVTDVLLKGIKLPAEVRKAIELKAKAEQDAAKMEFVLQKAKKEAERKAIEAKGIAEFQRIVSAGISPELIKWKGIEATTMIADANNSKIIVMGNDEKGLPVIFSSEDMQAA